VCNYALRSIKAGNWIISRPVPKKFQTVSPAIIFKPTCNLVNIKVTSLDKITEATSLKWSIHLTRDYPGEKSLDCHDG